MKRPTISIDVGGGHEVGLRAPRAPRAHAPVYPHTDASAPLSPRAARRVDAPGLLVDRPGCLIAGAGTPVVLLHASLGSKWQWTALARRLAPRYRVVALDLLGYGDNAACDPDGPFTLDDEVRHVERRLDLAVGAREPVHLVGHSYGGLVALRYAQLCASRVASLTVFEPVVFRVLDDDPARKDVRSLAQRVFRLVATGRPHDAARTFVGFWSGEGSYAALSAPAQADLTRRIDKVLLDFRAAAGWPAAPQDLRAIVAPTLLLGGARSPVAAQRMHLLLAQALPNVRVGTFECGHMGPVTDAMRINPWIEAFVDVCASGRRVADVAPAPLPAAIADPEVHRNVSQTAERVQPASAPGPQHASIAAAPRLTARSGAAAARRVDRYPPASARAAFGLVAVALAVLTLGLLVLVPAWIEDDERVQDTTTRVGSAIVAGTMLPAGSTLVR